MSKKCEFGDCKKKILSLAIDCDKCHKYYCGVHRIPESHCCTMLSCLREEAYENNKKVLENNKMEVVNKALGTY